MSLPVNSAGVAGFATPDGTERYRARFPVATRQDFYKRAGSGLWMSSIGVGTYLGEVSDIGDELYAESIRIALTGGVNVIDTAIKYRCMRSERVVGRTIGELVSAAVVARDEIFVSTKGGLIGVPEGEDAQRYIETTIIGRFGVSPDAITNGEHCIAPAFIRAQLDASLEHLGLSSIDCYFIHNPELALARRTGAEFERTLAILFELLEREIDEGRIRAYGLASWTGFRVWRGSRQFLDLERIHRIARRVNSNCRFRAVEVPLSIGMPATYGFTNQTAASRPASILEAARALGLDVLISGAVYGGKLTELRNLFHVVRRAAGEIDGDEPSELKVSLPQGYASLVQLFELFLRVRDRGLNPFGDLDRLSFASGCYPKALDVVRSLPDVTTALVGCDRPSYLREHLALATTAPCDASALIPFWRALSGARTTETVAR